MEWYERYLQYVANPNPGFDWKGWHRDGLLFTEQIYLSLPFSAYVNSRLLSVIIPNLQTSSGLQLRLSGSTFRIFMILLLMRGRVCDYVLYPQLPHAHYNRTFLPAEVLCDVSH